MLTAFPDDGFRPPMSSALSIAPSAGRRWGVLVLLMALCFISHFNRASITSAGDERIIQQFGISPERMGLVYSSFLLAYTIFMIPGGWFIDLRGPRVAMACMGIGSAVFCAMTGVLGFGVLAAGQVWMTLMVVRCLMGIFSTPLHPGAARCIGGWFPPTQQPLANGTITGASVLAYALVHPVFGGLIDWVDWPKAFLVTGAITAGLALIWFVVARDLPVQGVEELPLSAEPEGDLQPPEILWDRRLVLLTLSYAAVGYFQYLFFYWLHYYFDQILKMDKLESRFYAGLPNLAMAVAMPLGGWITDQLERKRGVAVGRALMPKIAMPASAFLLLGGVFSTERFWIVFWFTLALGCLGLCESSFWTTAVQIGRGRGGTSAAIMNTGGNGIGLIAPMLTPVLSQWLGWKAGIGFGAVVCLLGAICWLGIRSPAGSARPKTAV
jgi:ACS family D-galactonate transporter-like MFS transporter